MLQQTRNHILQMSPVVACHEVLFLPQHLLVPWRVEFPFVEQVLPPVYVCMCVCMYRQQNYIAIMYVKTTTVHMHMSITKYTRLFYDQGVRL